MLTGRSGRPPDPPARRDVAARAAVEPSLLRRTATAEVPVRAGVAILTGPFPASHQHNQLLLGDTGTGITDVPFDAASVTADADRVLGGAGLAQRTARLAGPHAARTARALQGQGWTVQHVITMAAPTRGGESGPVAQVDLATLRPALAAAWHRAAPDATPEQVAQLVERNRATEAVTDLRYLAVVERGAVVASALLAIDGATARLDDVVTGPAHRRGGRGDALVAAALALAAHAGCDLVTLDALADDFPGSGRGTRPWPRR